MSQIVRRAVTVALGPQVVPLFDVAEALCSRSQCGGIAAWSVGARVWRRKTERRQDNYVSVRFPLTVCDWCKEKIIMPDIIDNQGWQQIVKELRAQGWADPDRTSLQFEFEQLAVGTA